MSIPADPALNMLINRLRVQIPSAHHALLMSLDGLVVAHADGLTEDDADRLAAANVGIWSIANGIGNVVTAGGAADQVIVRYDHRWLFVGLAAPGTCFAVVVDGQADPQTVGFQLERAIGGIRDHLATAPRTLAAAGGPPRT
jgi:predicted regulator of Ras-like GTPase activity (Roadblock/LC7/MglB family)